MSFYIFNKVSETDAELLLYGSIADSQWFGDEVTPTQFAADLKALGNVKNITVRVNCNGGDVFSALAISGMLRDNPANITARIDGLCASAATIIVAFADKSQASANSNYVIHNASTIAAGDYRAMDKASEILKQTDASLMDIYSKKTGLTAADLKPMMDAETWMTGKEAVEKGFIDELVGDNLNCNSKTTAIVKPTISNIKAVIEEPVPVADEADTFRAELELLNLI